MPAKKKKISQAKAEQIKKEDRMYNGIGRVLARAVRDDVLSKALSSAGIEPKPGIDLMKQVLEARSTPHEINGEDSWSRAQRMWTLYAKERKHPHSWDELGIEEQNAWHTVSVHMMDELAGHPVEGVPLPMRLVCPDCGALHIDTGEFATKVHHTHACQECGMVWRPAVHPTVGVAFLPGFKNKEL